ncbi:hypothetical protein ABC955_11660 [Citromicrobium bathyomarinum]
MSEPADSEQLQTLTFAQANGFAPIPEQAKPGTISEATTAALWRFVHDHIDAANNSRGHPLTQQLFIIYLRKWWVEHAHLMIDDAPLTAKSWKSSMRRVFELGFPHSYNLIQFLLDQQSGHKYVTPISNALVQTRAAYRVVNRKLVPFASREELLNVKRAFSLLSDVGATGAQVHLENAASAMSSGNWTTSVHQSVSAIEAAMRFKTSDDKGTLPTLIKKLDSTVIAHPALAEVLKKLYGYASDEAGVRHSQTGMSSDNVTEKEAFFVFGVASSAVTLILAS